MKKNPIVIFTGLAVAAVAGVAGLTRDQWMGRGPATMEKVAEAASGGQSSESKQPEPQQAQAPAAEQPAAQQPAAEPVQQAQQPAAEANQQASAEPPPAAPSTEQQPAASATQQQTAEQPAAPEPPAQAAAPAAEPPAQPAETQPAETQPTQQQAAAPSTEQAAAPQPEAPAAAPEEQPAAGQTAEQPAAQESQQAAVQPQQEQPAIQAPAAAPKEEPAPTFDTVRIEKTGEAVIAGRAQPNDQVDVKLNGESIGKTTANSDGSFVVVPEQPLPAGSGSLTIEAKGDGEAMANPSEQTVAIIVPEQAKDNALVAVISPNEPTKVLQKPKPAETVVAKTEPGAEEEPAAAAKPRPVSLDAVDYDAAGNIVFSGQGQAGSAARIYVDNAVAGDAPIGPDGRWVFSGTTKIAAGTHQLRIDGIDAAGKVLSRIEAPFFREDTTKVASAGKTDKVVPDTTQQAGAPASAAGEQQQAAEAGAPAAEAPKGPREGRLIIQPGNNLWRISKVIYGDGLKYAMLYEANKDQIRDPDLIYPGQVFRTPEANPPETIDPAARGAMVESSTQ